MTRRAGHIGPYRLIAKLEQGGMAEVHLAVTEDKLGSLPLRALKVMPKELLDEPHLTEMFLDEARLAVRLSHPNVVSTMEVGEADGSLFLAMELLEGETVHRLSQRATHLGEELPLRAALAIVLGVLQGLHYVHELTDLDGRPLGIVHRDITPSNIYVTTSGTVKVCDFGIAKTQVQHAVTVVGMRKGKLGYLAPEQMAGLAPDPRADLYACGVVLWELVTSRRLFRRGRELGSRAPRLDEASPSAPSSLADVCARALAHDRRDRYESALAMWTDLDAVARELEGPLPALELGRWVEHLVGEDVRNLRRLTANALRDNRAIDTLDRPTQAPEATSFTVRPGLTDRPRVATRWAVGAVLVATLGLALAGQQLSGDLPSPQRMTSAPAAAAAPLVEPETSSTPASALRSTVRIEPSPEDATVVLDGVALAPPYVVEVDGTLQHSLEVSAPGYLSRTLHLEARTDLLVQANLIEMPPKLAPPPLSPPRHRRAVAAPLERATPPAPSASAISPTLRLPSSGAPSPDISRDSPLRPRELDRADPW